VRTPLGFSSGTESDRDLQPEFSDRVKLFFIEKEWSKPNFPKSLNCIVVNVKFRGYPLGAKARINYTENTSRLSGAPCRLRGD